MLLNIDKGAVHVIELYAHSVTQLMIRSIASTEILLTVISVFQLHFTTVRLRLA